MARLSLTATAVPGTGPNAPLDITALLASLGANTGVSFSWNPQYKLYVLTVTGSTTIVVNIGTTIETEPVTSITVTAATSGHMYVVGTFPQDEETSAGVITVDFGTPANVSGVALIQG